MPARVCPNCETPWPHNEVYKTAFGTKAVRSTNEYCPVCNVLTVFHPGSEALTPDAIEVVLEHAAAVERREAFERWYADREALRLHLELESWPLAAA